MFVRSCVLYVTIEMTKNVDLSIKIMYLARYRNPSRDGVSVALKEV